MSRRRKVLYGVCGIGLGHTFRQQPMLDHFAGSDEVLIFAYARSFEFYSKYFAGVDNVAVQEVKVPFITGKKEGLDFEASLNHPSNVGVDFVEAQLRAWDRASRVLGKPDLVVSDYEPVSAGYAYASGAPLVTVDQQSKYLCGVFPEELEGEGYADEVERLGLFFPAAARRIACSFFSVDKKADCVDVDMVGPVIRRGVRDLKGTERRGDGLLLYLSSQREFVQSYEEVLEACGNLDMKVYAFFKEGIPSGTRIPGNVRVQGHGSGSFDSILGNCAGIVSSAGHTLLSEAMFLGVPAYVVPLGVYEQQMNARIIGENAFGLARETIDAAGLEVFVDRLPEFERNIQLDGDVLIREPGQGAVISALEEILG